MKEGVILKEHRIFFEMLDPLGFMDRAEFPDRVVIGTVVEDKKGGHDVPAGLLVLRITEKNVTIEWLFVLPELRHHGIGSRLMRLAFDVAQNAGHDRIEAYTCDRTGRRTLCPFQDEFFDEYSFVKSTELGGEWQESLEGIISAAFVRKGDPDKDSSIALGLIDREMLPELSSKAILLPGACFSYDLEKCFELADSKVSRVIRSDDELEGVILAQEASNKLYITGMAAKDKRTCDMLVRGFANAAIQKKYRPKTRVCVLKYSENYADILSEYMTVKYDNYIYDAGISERAQVLDRFKPLESLSNISSFIAAAENDESEDVEGIEDADGIEDIEDIDDVEAAQL